MCFPHEALAAPGMAVVGAPLDVRAAMSSARQGCVRADVAYGDVALPAAAVRLTREPHGWRIQSAMAVDEPVVTVVMHSGCNRPVTRRIVFLAEPPGTAATPATAAAATAPTARADARGAAQPPRALPAKVLPAKAQGPVTPQGDGGLVLTSMALTPPALEPAQRAAAHALWNAVASSTEDRIGMSARLRSLEDNVASLTAQSARLRAEAQGFGQEIQANAERSRFQTLAAAAVLLLMAAAAGWVWLRSRELAPIARRWQRPSHVPDFLGSSRGQLTADAAPRQQESDASAVASLTPDAPAAPQVPQTPPLEQAPLSRIEALTGAFQQCEFFVSLGQYEEGIAFLRDYIESAPSPCVLAYYDLLSLYCGLGRREDARALRDKFKVDFGTEPPAPAPAPDRDGGLEAFPTALVRITAAWRRKGALDTIEDVLFERPPQARNLLGAQACRELLQLHALRIEVDADAGRPVGMELRPEANLPACSVILPWETLEATPAELSAIWSRQDVARGSSSFGVDVNLDAMPPPDAYDDRRHA